MQGGSLFRYIRYWGEGRAPTAPTLSKVGQYDYSPRGFCEECLVVVCHEHWFYHLIEDADSPRVFVDVTLRGYIRTLCHVQSAHERQTRAVQWFGVVRNDQCYEVKAISDTMRADCLVYCFSLGSRPQIQLHRRD